MRKEKWEELKTYIESVKTIQREKQGEGTFLTSEKWKYTLANKESINRECLLKNGKVGHASIILPVTKEGEILIVIEPRVFTKTTVGIGLPAGYIEEGEKPKMAGLRELLEEVGYKPQKMKHLISYYQDEGCSGAYNHSFLALGCHKVAKQNLDDGEYIHYMTVNFKELMELRKKGLIQGANSLLTIETAKKYLKKML